MASLAQQSALLDFLEDHPDLARGRIQKSKEGRAESRRLWETCASILNAQDRRNNKNAEKWRKYYIDMKTKLRNRLFEQKSSRNGTEREPRRFPLSNVQKRLLSLLGRDLKRQNSISQNMETPRTPPVVDAAPTTTAETDSDRVVVMMVDSEDVSSETEQLFHSEWLPERPQTPAPSSPDEAPQTSAPPSPDEAPQSPAPSSPDEAPQTPAPSSPVEAPKPTPQPPADSSRKRKRRRQRRLQSPLDEPVSELRAAQEQLERLEAEAASATREVASATREVASAVRELAAAHREGSHRLAAALEVMARALVDRPPTRRRRRRSSDEE